MEPGNEANPVFSNNGAHFNGCETSQDTETSLRLTLFPNGRGPSSSLQPFSAAGSRGPAHYAPCWGLRGRREMLDSRAGNYLQVEVKRLQQKPLMFDGLWASLFSSSARSRPQRLTQCVFLGSAAPPTEGTLHTDVCCYLLLCDDAAGRGGRSTAHLSTGRATLCRGQVFGHRGHGRGF